MSAVLVGYEHFLGIAARLAWKEIDIDLAQDNAAWPELDPGSRDRVSAFVAAFALAEECVAVDLHPFIEAAPNARMADCFRAQARDEERHARFFDRYAREVLAIGDTSEWVSPHLRTLFEERLGTAVRELASGRLRLVDAVALYHLVLEGVVFSAGQSALMEELRRGGKLPGLGEGLARIVADERWHIGLGVRVLSGDGTGVTTIDAEAAIGVWGSMVTPDRRAAALRQHRRRLAAAGLTD